MDVRLNRRMTRLGVLVSLAPVICGFGLYLGGWQSFAQTADRATTEAMVQRATNRMKALEREADQLAAEEKTLLNELRKLDLNHQLKVEQARALDAEGAQVEGALTATSTRIAALEALDAAALPALRARLVEMYKLGQGRYLRLLLSTADIRHVGEAIRTVAELAQIDHDRMAAHVKTLDDMRSARATLEGREHELEMLRADAARAQAAVETTVAARNAAIANIDQQRDLNAQLAGELAGAQQKLQVALRDLGTAGATAAPEGLPLKPFRGDLSWPADGVVRRRFARPAAGQLSATSAIEIAAAEGAPVTAIHEGTVAFADAFTGFGNLVILDHGAQTFSLYGNLARLDVAKGAQITAGQVLGTVGVPPVGPPGLYFELRIDGQPVDPLQWLKKRS